MKVSLYYESNRKKDYTWLEVPDESEFNVMIERDYQERLAKAKPGERVERRTAQEILDETSKEIFNSHHSETRNHVSYESYDPEGKHLASDTDIEEETATVDYSDLHEELKKLPPEYQELIRKVYWDEIPQVRIAEAEGLGRKAINNRLVRIYAKIRENLNPEIFFYE